MGSLLLKNAVLATPGPDSLRGPGLAAIEPVPDMSVLIQDGRIAAVGRAAEFESHAGEVLDCAGKTLVPGLVDCHTHLVFAGHRADEFDQRVSGMDYQAIAARGGGIAATVSATRQATSQELYDSALKRLDMALSHGTTTMEVKSGYGLDFKTEMKMLEVVAELDKNHPIDLVPTFLGAHAVPKMLTKDEYLDQVLAMLPKVAGKAKFCDVFCEQGYFTPADSVRVLSVAKDFGMTPKMHANQFHSMGCIQAALALGVSSVDHLEVLSESEIELLEGTDIVCVALPGVSLFLDIPFAPMRGIMDSGCMLAIATDFNPGSNMCLNLPLMLNLACVRGGLSVSEALTCATMTPAKALKLDKVGCIAPGWQADILILDTDNFRDLAYFYGQDHVAGVIKKGEVIL